MFNGPGHAAAPFALVALALALCSCTSYKATASNQRDLPYDGVQVQPGWEYQDRPARRLILPVIGAAAGAVYGYSTTFTYEDQTFEGEENAGIWAGAGLLAGLAASRVVFPNRRRQRRAFDPSESDSWLQSYNRTVDSNYLIRDVARNGSLVLVPRSAVIAIRQEYGRLEEDLRRPHPTTTYGGLGEWRQKLSGEYSILPDEEIRHVESVLTTHESKVASVELETAIADVQAMPDVHGSLSALLRYGPSLGPVYSQASPEARQRFDQAVRTKVDVVLTRVLPEEERLSDQVGTSLSDLSTFERQYAGFSRRYQSLRDHDAVRAVDDRFRQKKQAIIAANAAAISSEIDASTSVQQADALHERYFADIGTGSAEVVAVQNRLRQRREAIVEAERQRRIAAQTRAQRRAQAELQAERSALTSENAALAANGLSVRGLTNGTLFSNLYAGEFEDIPVDREDIRFATLYGAYLNAYGEQCDHALPPNKEMMTYQECSSWTEVRNGYGMVINSYCTGWRTRETGIYADPDMLRAKNELELIQTTDVFRNAINMISGDDPIGEAAGLLGSSISIRGDVAAMVRANGCTSPALQRFEDNLKAFARNERPRRLDGDVTGSPVITPRPGTLFEDQNYVRLLEDLVADQAESWAMNRLVGGSVTGVQVTTRDGLGRPTEVTARYTYNGFNGRTTGRVRLTFDDGWPECLYFADNPIACRTPNRRIVAAYEAGRYGR